jgi:hypothetical protein
MKKFIPYFLLLFYFINFLSVPTHANDSLTQNYLQRSFFENQLPYLKEQFGKNKQIPESLEMECLVALSFYPQLKDVPITFTFGRTSATMTAQPKISSFFKSQESREYKITINTSKSANIRLEQLSFNAIVGWIGHELAHITQYMEKSNGGLLVTGLSYLIPGYRKKFERETDLIAIQHYMGFALYEGVQYAICCSGASSSYKAYVNKYYLSPEEIISEIENLYPEVYIKSN